jgi:hypothetical protein
LISKIQNQFLETVDKSSINGKACPATSKQGFKVTKKYPQFRTSPLDLKTGTIGVPLGVGVQA